MAKVIGIDGMSDAEINAAFDEGARLIVYHYTISIFVMTFRRPSNIYFIRPGESAVVKGLPFTLLSLVVGWWGIPWGPIYTVGSVVKNLSGGEDVTPFGPIRREQDEPGIPVRPVINQA